MSKLVKVKDLKNYGIPSYILNIWGKHYSPYLLPLQETMTPVKQGFTGQA